MTTDHTDNKPASSSRSGSDYSEAEKAREFQRFFRDHYDMGFRYLRALRFPYNSLRDVLSHCFELAWKRFDEYLERDKPRYWFYNILKNKAGYSRRKFSRNAEYLGLSGDDGVVPGDPRPTPEAQLLAKERRSFFYATITRIPAIYSDVVRLRLSGYDYNFISDSLGISVTNAQTRMRRAVVMLEKAFAEYLELYGMDV